MALPPQFPTNPHAVLAPEMRWYPGDDVLAEVAYENLLPPLVHKVRQGVKAWRDSGYAGASATTQALLRHWFQTEHLLPQADGTMARFQYYFAQREAVESALWLYEIEQARDPYALLKYDSSGRVSKGMFPEDWTRYVLKLATGAGKTKVMSLLIAWAYFHKRYEPDSDLSANFLLIAPNIIVLDRLVGGFDVLFGKVKEFVERHLFAAPLDLDDPIVPRNLSEVEATRAILETFKTAINALTVQARGTTEVCDRIKLSQTRPYLVSEQGFVKPKRSLFNKVTGNDFELEFAAFLDECAGEIISFVKNSQSTGFRIEYQTANGAIANYYPDFIVKETESCLWIIETKGREDLEDPPKWERLKQWCADATARDAERRQFRALFVRQEDWAQLKLRSFAELKAAVCCELI